MKFVIGDQTDQDLCIALEHEYLRCYEAFKDFEKFAAESLFQREEKRLRHRAFSAYTDFIHHFYEFMLGAYCREREETDLTTKRGSHLHTDGYINSHAQRVITAKRKAIKNGTAPEWENALSAYPELIAPNLAQSMRKIRNEATGHVGPKRADIDLIAFFKEHHMALYWLYRDAYRQWGPKDAAFPDWKEITKFTV